MPGDGSGQRSYDEVVQFGGGRRWVSTALLTCLVLAAIATVAVSGAGHHAVQSRRSPPPPPVRVTKVGHRLIGVASGWELFARGPDDLVRIQLAQGRITQTYVPSLESANPDVAFLIGVHEAVIRSTDVVPGYVVPDGGQARLLTGPIAGGGPLVPGPAPVRAAWVSSGSPASPALSLVELSGRPSGPTIRFRGAQVPATAVSDGRGYVLVESGSFSVYDAGPSWDRLVPGTIVAVGPANWLLVTCNPHYRHCRDEVIDTGDGARRVLPGRATGYPGDFSWPPTGVIAPDGSTAAVAETRRSGLVTVHLINLRSGVDTDLNIPLGLAYGDMRLGGGSYDQSMVWSPDSRYLFVAASGGKLVAVDARSGRAESLGVTLPPVVQVGIRA
jgi:hypothetical protein